MKYLIARLAIPISLTITGIFLLICWDSPELFAISVVGASILAMSGLYRMVSQPSSIRFSTMLAVSILLGYGLGSAIYLVAYDTTDATQYQYWALHGLTFSQEGLSKAFGAILVSVALLYLAAIIERPAIPIPPLDCLDTSKPERLVWLGLVVVLVAFLQGDIGYMGPNVDQSNHVSVLGSLACLMVPPLIPYSITLIAGKRPFYRKVVLGVATLGLIFILFFLGRRYLIYALVLAGAAWRQSPRPTTGWRIIKWVGFCSLALIILYFGSSFFLALRLVVNEMGGGAGPLELFRQTMAILTGGQLHVVQHVLEENIGSRPFILSYLAGLVGLHSVAMPDWGAEAVYSIQMAIPSVFMPGKLDSLPPAAENLVHPLYGIPTFDGPNSFLVAGFDDFDLAGIIVYPLIVSWLYRSYFRIVSMAAKDHMIRVFLFFALLFQLLYIEQALSATFVAFRDLIIVVGVAWLVGKVPSVRIVPRRSPIATWY